jgi:hypothetical protein
MVMVVNVVMRRLILSKDVNMENDLTFSVLGNQTLRIGMFLSIVIMYSS